MTGLAFIARLFRCELNPHSVVRIVLLLAATISCPQFVPAQVDRATVVLDVSTPGLVKVIAKPKQQLQTWSFLNAYAGALGISERVHNFRADGEAFGVIKRIATGVYQSDRPLRSIAYEVNLSLSRASDAANVSWVTSDGGVLMLADLLPTEIIQEAPLNARIVLPNKWEIQPLMTSSGDRTFTHLIEDPTNTVLSVGPSLKHDLRTVNGTPLRVVLSGDWSFRIATAAQAAKKVFKEYSELTQFRLSKPSTVIIMSTPSLKGAEAWQAQTRGSTLLLLIDPHAQFKNWKGQLEVIFTHELFHLWVPNALKLEGEYDWFFEGFTLYQALLTALDLKVISFDEYLTTLGRVYDSYRSQPDRLSLIEASEQRWTGGATTVYDKGMLVAFLYDLKLRSETRGRSKLPDRYPEVFRKYTSKTANANEAIMSVLISSPATEALLKSFVEERRALDLTETLKEYGIAVESEVGHTYLKITTNPTSDQLRLLNSLGYRR